MAKDKEKSEKKSGSFFSRGGIPLILTGVLGLAALSFITLSILKHGDKPDEKAKPIETKVSQSIKPPAPPKPIPAAVPSAPPASAGTAPGAASASPASPGETPKETTPPAAGVKPQDKPATTPPAAGVKPQDKPATTPPAAGTKPQDKPATTPPVKPAEAGAPVKPDKGATKETADKPAPKPEPVKKAKLTPSDKKDVAKPGDKKGASEAGAATAPATGTKTGETAKVVSSKPSADVTKPIFPPPPATKKAAGDNGIPKPLWQTVDQNWDKIRVEDAAEGGNIQSGDASWKQINVGQKDEAKPAKTTVPTPTKKAALTAKKTPDKSQKTSGSKTARVKKTKYSGKKVASSRTYKKKRPYRSSSYNSKKKINLAIINESGQPGQAEIYRDVLQAMGYSVRKIEDRVPQPGPTTILYGAGFRSRAANLSRHIPGQRALEPQRAGTGHDIVILVR